MRRSPGRNVRFVARSGVSSTPASPGCLIGGGPPEFNLLRADTSYASLVRNAADFDIPSIAWYPYDDD